MLKFLKRLVILACIILVAILFWGAFAIWTGIYSIYTYPPSKDRPDGETLIVSREQGEPMFNSPAYKPPPQKPEPQSGGLRFGTIKKPARPLQERVIIALPYIDWAYQKSLEPEKPASEE
jgi:hypothetical protein